MIKRLVSSAALCGLLLLPLGTTQAVELMSWERIPLAIPLAVGHERVIFVDRNVRVGMDASLAGKLRVQSTGGTVYLLATEEIPPTRLQIQDVETSEILLFDIAASDGSGPLEPVRIVTPGTGTRKDAAGGDTDAQSVGKAPAASTAPMPVLLTRYAAQNLYAPLRAVEPLPGVRKLPKPVVDTASLLPTYPVHSRALVAYRAGGLVVTAVKLTNRSTRTLQLDPRHLQGDLMHATFQHNTLGPAGTAEDTTAVYLITLSTLDRALLPIPTVAEASK